MLTDREYGARRRAAGELPPVPVGYWVIAATPASEPYPCDCHTEGHHRRRPTEWCPCYGRTDLGNVGDECCAARFVGDPVAAAAAAARVKARDRR